MCRLRNIAMCDYQESVTTKKVWLPDRQTDRQTPDKVIPLCRYASQATQQCMCRLRNIAMCDYQESVTTAQTDGQTDAGQSDPFVPLCFAGDTTITYYLRDHIFAGPSPGIYSPDFIFAICHILLFYNYWRTLFSCLYTLTNLRENKVLANTKVFYSMWTVYYKIQKPGAIRFLTSDCTCTLCMLG